MENEQRGKLINSCSTAARLGVIPAGRESPAAMSLDQPAQDSAASEAGSQG